MQLPMIITSEDETIPLTNDNVVLKGMSLKITEKIYGIVIYTGH